MPSSEGKYWRGGMIASAPLILAACGGVISGPSTQLPPGISQSTPNCFGCLPGLTVDTQRDHLYVSVSNDTVNSNVTAKVLVFNNAGTAARP